MKEKISTRFWILVKLEIACLCTPRQMSKLTPHQHLLLFPVKNESVTDKVEGQRTLLALGWCVLLKAKFQKSHKRVQKDTVEQQKGAELGNKGELLSVGLSKMSFDS